jgi:hypothetical protein
LLLPAATVGLSLPVMKKRKDKYVLLKEQQMKPKGTYF